MNTGQAYGIHAVARRIEQSPRQCLELFCAEKPGPRLRKLIEQAEAAGIAVHLESRDGLTTRCGTSKHQGCVLLTRETAQASGLAQCLESIGEDSLLLVLDGVQDPHNLGACLRTADACGVDAVIVPKDRAAGLSATVRKVAAGAADTVPLVAVTNIARSLGQLKQAGAWIYGTSDDAPASLYDFDYRGPVALVMGGEGGGLRRLTRESCDQLVALPMRGRVESLNVSVATGVCLYEILRSRSSTP
jgi:23S rRNA (guanosine2251-2'-O)-methyltransferase